MCVMFQAWDDAREPSLGWGLVDWLFSRRSSRSAGGISHPGLPTATTRCQQRPWPVFFITARALKKTLTNTLGGTLVCKIPYIFETASLLLFCVFLQALRSMWPCVCLRPTSLRMEATPLPQTLSLANQLKTCQGRELQEINAFTTSSSFYFKLHFITLYSLLHCFVFYLLCWAHWV